MSLARLTLPIACVAIASCSVDQRFNTFQYCISDSDKLAALESLLTSSLRDQGASVANYPSAARIGVEAIERGEVDENVLIYLVGTKEDRLVFRLSTAGGLGRTYLALVAKNDPLTRVLEEKLSEFGSLTPVDPEIGVYWDICSDEA